MASLSVFTCAGAAQSLVQVTAEAQAPACENGQGGWQQVVIAEPFDPAQLNTQELMEASSAGFVITGSALVFILVARFVLDSFWGGRTKS